VKLTLIPVHEFPIAAGDNTCMSAGGHYDPFRANGTLGLVNATNGAPSPLYHPSPANLSTFQIGDLAGKWGALTSVNGSLEARTIIEHYIRLSGEYSVMSRSVVIHDAPTDTRIACT
jgi:Cu/Zn superoxide dismutase